MNILVTGAKGMVGTALVANLKNIKENKNRTRPDLHIDEIYEYDLDSTAEQLDAYCQSADFIFNLAGVNRPENPEDFMKGNFGFASTLLDTLKKHNNKATIMLSPVPSRPLWPAASATRSTGALRKPGRSCSSPMQRKPEQRSRFTASRT